MCPRELGGPQKGDCLGDNSTLGYVDRLVNRGTVDGFSLLNLNQLCKQTVLYERVWMMQPPGDVVEGLQELVEAFHFFMPSQLEQLNCVESEIGNSAKSQTLHDVGRSDVSELWSRVLGKSLKLSAGPVHTFYESPLFYDDGVPGKEKLGIAWRRNPSPLDSLQGEEFDKEFAVAATYRANLYLELSSRLKLRYIPDMLRTEFVEWKLQSDISELGPDGLQILRKISSVLEERYDLKRKRFDSHELEAAVEFPFFLFLVLDGATKPRDVIGNIRTLRDSRDGRRIRDQVRMIEGGGEQALKSMQALDHYLSELGSDSKSSWSSIVMMGILSTISFAPLELLSILMSKPDGQFLFNEISSVVKLGVSATQIANLVGWLVQYSKRRRFAMLEHLITGAQKGFESSFLNRLDDLVWGVWKKRLTDRDKQLISTLLPIAVG